MAELLFWLTENILTGNVRCIPGGDTDRLFVPVMPAPAGIKRWQSPCIYGIGFMGFVEEFCQTCV
jgi:hypothetical protein